MHVNFIFMKLTKIGCSQSQPSVYYVTPPLAIMEFLNFDDSTALVTRYHWGSYINNKYDMTHI